MFKKVKLFLVVLFWCFCQFQNSWCLFEQCNHKVHLKAGGKLFINSPYYPGEYPVGTSCRYVVTAPEDYGLKFKCDIKMNTISSSTRCVNEIFYFNREGSEVLTGSEFFCGRGLVERTSFLNRAVISYISTPQNKRTLLSNAVKEGEQEMAIKEVDIRKTLTPTTKTSVTTTTTTTKKPLKVATVVAATTTKTSTSALRPVASKPPTTSTWLTSSLTSTPLRPDKNVSNSFAYVVALLSNKIDTSAFINTNPRVTGDALTLPPPPLPFLYAAAADAVTSRPTSVFDHLNTHLPVSTWRNGSIAIPKISSKRVPKVIVGQDYTSQSGSGGDGGGSGGGLFSCLVEVIEPTCECGWSSTTKIAGASGVAGINEFPSMAGVLLKRTQRIFCGAAIIHHRFLLSAAHCYVTQDTNRPEYIQVVVGEHDLSTVLESIYTRYYDIANIILHEHFRSTAARVHNDIALLKTRHPIEWNRSVGPACLPFIPTIDLNGSRKPPVAGQRVETAGWGTTSFGGQQSTVLLKTTLDVISREQCQNIIHYLPSGAFCTYTPGRDTCQYDSGGALYARGERLYAVGIVSYGFACATDQPSVNTRVSSHLKWIRSKTVGVKYCIK